jgi:hydrogenase nickel insertion protein HypA
MHETGIAEAIIEALRRVQAQHEQPIKRATIRISELSGISGEHLVEHFSEAAEGTEFEDVVLETEVSGIMAKCMDCDTVVEASEDLDACPSCGSTNLTLHTDDAIKLVSVE